MGIRSSRKKIAAEDDVPVEKWLAAFRNPDSKKQAGGLVFLRQFYAPGFYEAYDAVVSHAEKMRLEVLWFREKRSCGQPLASRDFPELESVCTYCNKKFNHLEPIPCPVDACSGEFCSRECLCSHGVIRHRKSEDGKSNYDGASKGTSRDR